METYIFTCLYALGNQKFRVRGWSLAMCSGELAAIMFLKLVRWELELAFHFHYCRVVRECQLKENPAEKSICLYS